jgi:hypothetical protein
MYRLDSSAETNRAVSEYFVSTMTAKYVNGDHVYQRCQLDWECLICFDLSPSCTTSVWRNAQTVTDFCTVTTVSELASHVVNKLQFGGGRLRENYKRWTARAAENYKTTATSARANTRESSSSRWLTKKDLTRDRGSERAERENRVNLGKERCSRVTEGRILENGRAQEHTTEQRLYTRGKGPRCNWNN